MIVDVGRVNAGEGYIGAAVGVIMEVRVARVACTARGDCKGTGTGS